MLIEHKERGRVAIMIEDKIDAPPQPQQVERYHQRGRQGIADGLWQEYFTCLCSPQKYLPEENRGEWHCLLRFEEIISHLEQSSERDVRTEFVVKVLQQAIKKRERGSLVPDLAAKEFWDGYKRFCQEEFPNLSVSRVGPAPSRNECWPAFAAGMLPSDVRLEHKPSKGRVHLTFSNRRVDDVKPKLLSLLSDTQLLVERTSNSCALSREVGKVNITVPFELQRTAVHQALDAVHEILAVWPKVRSVLGFWNSTALNEDSNENRSIG